MAEGVDLHFRGKRLPPGMKRENKNQKKWTKRQREGGGIKKDGSTGQNRPLSKTAAATNGTKLIGYLANVISTYPRSFLYPKQGYRDENRYNVSSCGASDFNTASLPDQTRGHKRAHGTVCTENDTKPKLRSLPIVTLTSSELARTSCVMAVLSWLCLNVTIMKNQKLRVEETSHDCCMSFTVLPDSSSL